MKTFFKCAHSISTGTPIIQKAQEVHLDPRILYEVVIDLSSEGLITANCLNMAAGILLNDLGLPNYFFENLTSESLKNILSSIATSITFHDNKVVLGGHVAHVNFNRDGNTDVQRVRIATEETRESMEKLLETLLSGHRREYYYSPEKNYYTYIFRPETVNDYDRKDFRDFRFLFNLAGDFNTTPEVTRTRYKKFLKNSEKAVIPLIEVFNLPQTGETRLMFNSDFALPQLPVLRKLFTDHDLILKRAYWEPYIVPSSVPSSICSIYSMGELSRTEEESLLKDLRAYLAFSINDTTDLYVDGFLTFNEMLFAGNAVDFTHRFIFNERENLTDIEIMNNLTNSDHQDAFAQSIHTANRSTYVLKTILETVRNNPDLIKFLYKIFDKKFNPCSDEKMTREMIDEKFREFDKIITGRFMDFSMGYDIFKFMFKIVSCTLKTNFYKPEKRAFAFRFTSDILDPIVFQQSVFGIFYVNGHYASGTHLRAADIARGGLRMLRVTPSNYRVQLDNAVLLNYALGPKAQRLKHKDICESGSKGVIVPHAIYAGYSRDALNDYTEGIMDLMLGHDSIKDYYGRPEMLFFGPDEGTAPLMDAVAFHAKDRGYRHWRTITTGKSFGIPHDTYGILENNDLFGLVEKGEDGTDLQINGKSVVLTQDMDKIYDIIGGRIKTSGMTTTGVMASFRTLMSHYNADEKDLNLMMTGGPDGDLGANEIQCYKGKICLIIDGGSILFDPDGLDKKELAKIALMRHTAPRANSLFFPEEKLGPRGFKVPITGREITLPSGTFIEDGALFHRTFLTCAENREFIKEADIQAFIPCGGFKDTVNHSNVSDFVSLFQELKFIVEGANVFFDDASRRYIAQATEIKEIKDTSANKGGVFSSSIAEVLTALLLEDDYEKKLLENVDTRWTLIRNIMELVEKYSAAETDMLIKIHDKEPSIPLFELSEKTSEQIFGLQDIFNDKIETILENKDLVWNIMENYIPEILIQKIGKNAIMDKLNESELAVYRNAIITKKLSSMAFYKYGFSWESFLEEIKTNFSRAILSISSHPSH
ncbi:MAG: NAD-glutamate dehydrogenase [Thermodesulfobacteriota bacterium]|nr:NAD-glutamate dehydrogenase [Thermodesulfobacteriota bacterium]